MKNDIIIKQIIKSVSDLEKNSKDIVYFNWSLHSFFLSLFKRNIIDDFFITYSKIDEIHISIKLNNNDIFKSKFFYDNNLYNKQQLEQVE